MKSKTMFVGALLLCLTGLFTFTSSVQAQTICNNETGSQGGYTYEYWKDNGDGCMVLGSGGTFSIEWSNIGNLLARKGLRPGSRDQVVNYAANYQPNGNSYLCVYGWTTNPLIEYYIVESWGSWRPPGGEGYMGQVTSNGGTYDIYRTQRVNQPSIEGTATFYQFWSVRTSKRTSGTITCANHFNAWQNLGMQMGSLYEVSFCVEGYQSSGNADVYSMSMTTGTGDDDDDDDDDDTIKDAFSNIQAENYSSTSSSTLEQIGTPDGGNGIGYIESGDTVTYRNIDFGNGASACTFRAGSEQSSSIQIRVGSSSGTLLGTISSTNTGGWDTYQELSTNISNVTGIQDIVLVFSGPVNVDWFRFTPSGTADDDDDDDDNLTIPGTIEAENYTSMSGIEVEACGEGGENVGYIDQGDWMQYQVNVLQSGDYTVQYRVASNQSTGAFDFQVNGSTQHNVSVPNTGGWQSYQTVTRTVHLSAGTQTIRLTCTGQYWNINWMSFQLNGSGDDDDDDDVLVTIEAEDYNSTTSATIETIGTPDGGSGIGYIESGDTVTYRDLDFKGGVTTVTARVASEQNTSIQIRLGSSSGTLLGTISNTSTGDWDGYADRSANINEVSGVNDIVLVFSGPVNVDSITFSSGGGVIIVPTDFPPVSSLPYASSLPDPYEFMNGSVVSTPGDWQERVAEISGMYQYYMYGTYRDGSGESLSYSASNSSLSINVQRNGRSASFSVDVQLPSGSAPAGGWPVIVCFHSISPASYAVGRGYAVITMNTGNIASDDNSHSGAFYTLYPYGSSSQEQTGVLLAWTWGASKILDALEQGAGNQLNINPENSIITGVSRWGKAAAVCGAFEKRFKMAAPSCSGAGGLAVYRYTSEGKTYNFSSLGGPSSYTYGQNEPLGSLQSSGEQGWFNNTFLEFNSVNYLPVDQYMLASMVAEQDRYLFIIGSCINEDWVNAPSMWLCFKAAKSIFRYLGLEEHIAINIHLEGHAVIQEDMVKMLDYFDYHVYGKNPSSTDLSSLQSSVFELSSNYDAIFDNFGNNWTH